MSQLKFGMLFPRGMWKPVRCEASRGSTEIWDEVSVEACGNLWDARRREEEKSGAYFCT